MQERFVTISGGGGKGLIAMPNSGMVYQTCVSPGKLLPRPEGSLALPGRLAPPLRERTPVDTRTWPRPHLDLEQERQRLLAYLALDPDRWIGQALRRRSRRGRGFLLLRGLCEDCGSMRVAYVARSSNPRFHEVLADYDPDRELIISHGFRLGDSLRLFQFGFDEIRHARTLSHN